MGRASPCPCAGLHANAPQSTFTKENPAASVTQDLLLGSGTARPITLHTLLEVTMKPKVAVCERPPWVVLLLILEAGRYFRMCVNWGGGDGLAERSGKREDK